MSAPNASPPASRLAILGTLTFYTVSAISMTLLNKLVLNATPAPITLLICQSFVATALLKVCDVAKLIHLPSWDSKTAKSLMPLTIVNVLGLSFNNYCLSHVDASFHQVARGLVLPFTVICSIVMLRSAPSTLATVSTFVVTLGFFAGVVFDTHHNSNAKSSASATAQSGVGWLDIGVLFGVGSSLLSAVHAILIKSSLGSVGNSPLALSYYSNLLSGLVLMPLCLLFGEGPQVGVLCRDIINEAAMGKLWTGPGGRFIAGALITGIFGFLISLAAVLSIKVTSPVTHMISSAVRGVIQTVLSAWLFSDVIGSARILSIVVIILGSTAYVYAKHLEGEAAQRQRRSVVDLASPSIEKLGMREKGWLDGQLLPGGGGRR